MKYYFAAGERSGDLHAANLIHELKKQNPKAEFRGFGGDDMEKAGMRLTVHYRSLAVMGFLALFAKLFHLFKLIKLCKKDILEYKPDAIILVDFGGFNMRIAKFAKAHRFRVYYYIVPKIWAWHQSRAYKLKASVDKMFVILPFEKAFYKKFDIDAEYVGNPVCDAIRKFAPDGNFKEKMAVKSPIVALLPGSRRMELVRMLPVMEEVCKQNADIQFLAAAVSNLEPRLYEGIKALPNVKLVFENAYNVLSVSQAAIVTSGTATLETALFNVPQVVVYKTAAAEYLMAKQLIQTPHISLVNLIAEKEVVKEFIQREANAENIGKEVRRLLQDANYRQAMQSEYDKISKKLGHASASEKTAALIATLDKSR